MGALRAVPQDVVVRSIAALMALSLVSVTSGVATGESFPSSFGYSVEPDAYNDTVRVALPDDMLLPRIVVDDRPSSPFYGTVYVLGVSTLILNDTPITSCNIVVLSTSTDGGHSFDRPYRTGTCIPWSDYGSTRPILDVAVGTDGSLYLAFGTLNTIMKSRDQGRTWEILKPPKPIFGVNSVAVDPLTGVLYAVGGEPDIHMWPPPPSMFLTSSADGGVSWSPLVPLVASNESVGVDPRVAAYDGSAVVAFRYYTNSSGFTYEAVSAVTLSGGVWIWNNLSMDMVGESCVTGWCLSLYPPTIAVSPNGAFAISWTESSYSIRTGTGVYQNRVFASLSRDGGRTFSAPVLAGESGLPMTQYYMGPSTVVQDGPRIYVEWERSDRDLAGSEEPGTAKVFVAVSRGADPDFEEASFQTHLEYEGADFVPSASLAGTLDGPVLLAWEAFRYIPGTGRLDENASGVFVRAVAGDASGDIVGDSRSLGTVEIQLRDAVTGSVRARSRWSGFTVVLDRLPPGTYRVEVLADGGSSEVGEMPILTWSRTTFAIRFGAAPPLAWLIALAGLLVIVAAATFAGLQYTRLSKEAVLQRKVRLLLYEYIRDHPGSSFSAVRNALGLQNGVAAYHLAILEKQGLTRSSRHRYRRWYYPNGDASLWRDVPLSALQASIVENVRNSPGVGVRELARVIGRRSSSVSYNVKALVREGLLCTKRDGRRLRCYPAEEGAAE